MGNMARQLGEVAQILRTQPASQGIKKFSGRREEFQDWLDAIVGGTLLIGGSDRDKITIAFETSSGLVAKFIARFLDENRDATWEDLKTQLSLRFAAIKDRDHTLTLLQKCKQTKGESVPLFA